MIKNLNKIKAIILVVIISLAFIGIYMINKNYGNFKEKDSTIIMEKLSTISELATTKYYYSNIVSFKETKKIKEIEIPFTQKSFLIKYEGYIKAGIKLDEINVASINKDSIKIELNKPVILEHNVDERNVYVYDEKNAIFNKLSLQDMLDEISTEKVIIEKELISKGFLDEATNNAKTFLEEFLKDLGYEDIDIIFK
ncbi:DUF4230 domain-containing protein [Alkalithermobacter paradoxus]|uniref:DUF4230 domain-containing protein n=1 Tax=Alkalithermobacter paradoxus TaxID=29349 RepID=A0A1V4I8T9_9FIRM|nr:hypothetical protein CLOTH_11250 [[Clostridium] thermoalcaliphilum]